MRSHHDNHGTSYSAEVTYHYKVGGSYHIGTKVAFGAMSSSASAAREILARYTVGSKVPVHYLPDDPETAVLEPGIHGGTWICFGVGSVFVLAGVMFLQVAKSADKQSALGAATRARPIQINQPPLLMGVIFAIFGIVILGFGPSGEGPKWVVQAAGGMFLFIGVFLFTLRLHIPALSNVLLGMAGFLFLAIFHWVSFPGRFSGTSNTPFYHASGVNVRWPFAIFTILLDILVLFALGKRLARGRDE